MHKKLKTYYLLLNTRAGTCLKACVLVTNYMHMSRCCMRLGLVLLLLLLKVGDEWTFTGAAVAAAAAAGVSLGMASK
jgi:hypothetical protein